MVASKGSIADACRALNLNRQQFNKYLAGHGLPNRHNLSKITAYFGVDEIDLIQPPDVFVETMRKLRKVWNAGADVESEVVELAVAEVLEESRNSIFPEGCYDFYYPWSMDQSKIVRSVVVIFKDKQRLCFRRYTRLPGVTSDLKNFPSSRYDGIINSGGRSVHMLARNQRGHGEISLVSIGAARPRKPNVWFGLALIMTPVSEPLATRCTLVYRGERRMFRSLLKSASIGVLGPESIPAEIYRSLVPSIDEQNAQIEPHRFSRLLRTY